MKGDFLVDTSNPGMLDQTLQSLGAVLIGGPENFLLYEGHYVVRPLPPTNGLPRFACESQG